MSESVLSPRRRAYLRRQKRRRTAVHFLQVFLLTALLLLWELSARLGWIDAFIFSSPCRIAATLQTLWASGDLWLHAGTSCLETVVGFLLGTLLGTVIAVALWWSDFISRVLEPYLVVLNALPKTALGPIFIVWMGAGTASIVTMTLAISLIVTILNMHVSFLSTDSRKIQLMQTLGASRWQILRMLVLPSNYAALFNTLRVNVGLSWVGVIMGEFLVSKAGLGYLIVYGSQVFNMDLVMATVLLLAVAAVVMYQLVLWLEKQIKLYLGVIA
jgi:NitT/TauT family transport system permease protein